MDLIDNTDIIYCKVSFFVAPTLRPPPPFTGQQKKESKLSGFGIYVVFLAISWYNQYVKKSCANNSPYDSTV